MASETYVKNYVDNKRYTTLQEVYNIVDDACFPNFILLNDLGLTIDVFLSGEEIPIGEE